MSTTRTPTSPRRCWQQCEVRTATVGYTLRKAPCRYYFVCEPITRTGVAFCQSSARHYIEQAWSYFFKKGHRRAPASTARSPSTIFGIPSRCSATTPGKEVGDGAVPVGLRDTCWSPSTTARRTYGGIVWRSTHRRSWPSNPAATNGQTGGGRTASGGHARKTLWRVSSVVGANLPYLLRLRAPGGGLKRLGAHCLHGRLRGASALGMLRLLSFRHRNIYYSHHAGLCDAFELDSHFMKQSGCLEKKDGYERDRCHTTPPLITR